MICYNHGMSKLILITNPGSASRKYALYDGDELMAQLHFEYEGKKVVCTINDVDDGKKKIKPVIDNLNDAIAVLPQILRDEQYVTDQHKLAAVVVRIVAPGDYFTEDHIVDDEYMTNLKEAEKRNPIHVPTTANEIRGIRKNFAGVKIISVYYAFILHLIITKFILFAKQSITNDRIVPKSPNVSQVIK